MLYLKYLSIGKFYPRVLYGYNIMDNVDRKKKNKAQRLITFKHVIKYNNIIFQSSLQNRGEFKIFYKRNEHPIVHIRGNFV